MLISQLHIKGFRSLREVSLSNLGPFVVVVGNNNSGKTNVLEVLSYFFHQFAASDNGSLGVVSEYSWFDRDDTQPIVIDVTVTLRIIPARPLDRRTTIHYSIMGRTA